MFLFVESNGKVLGRDSSRGSTEFEILETDVRNNASVTNSLELSISKLSANHFGEYRV